MVFHFISRNSKDAAAEDAKIPLWELEFATPVPIYAETEELCENSACWRY
jgi:hypothetical protein